LVVEGVSVEAAEKRRRKRELFSAALTVIELLKPGLD
jgi:hypothetical protein